MGYYIPSSPQGFFLRLIVDVDWSDHFSPNQLSLIQAAGIFMDYSTIAGFGRLAGFNLPLASSRAALGTSFSWGSFLTSSYVVPVALYALALVGMTRHADQLIDVERGSGKISVSQALFDNYTRGKFQPDDD